MSGHIVKHSPQVHEVNQQETLLIGHIEDHIENGFLGFIEGLRQGARTMNQVLILYNFGMSKARTGRLCV